MGYILPMNAAAIWVSYTAAGGRPVSRATGSRSCIPACTTFSIDGSATSSQNGSKSIPGAKASISVRPWGVDTCTTQKRR